MITQVPGPVLKYYDPSKAVKVQVDASQTGLGAVVMQDGQPIAYASKSLTTAQQAYAQIEKEALALVFGCEKFHHYLYGRDFVAESDHKPLETIMKKPLHLIPMRLQRMRIRLQRYNVTVQYKPGKNIPVADTLSRSGACDSSFADDLGLDAYVEAILKQMPVSDGKLDEIRSATKDDSELQKLQKQVKRGWPDEVKQVGELIRPYWNYRDEITVIDGILFRSQKIIIPKALRQEMLRKIHTGHMGVQKCKERGRDVIFWPAMSKEIESLVEKCATCQEHRTAQQKEPLQPHEIPLRPWQRVATDLFVWNNSNYVLVVDYYSNYFEISQLNSTKSPTVIQHIKSIFARHGIPEIVISDNGPQYSSDEFSQFAKDWGFEHKTSSPTYPKSNGLAERTVQTVKNLLKKAKASNQDPYLSLLSYRNTPIQKIGSPAQLLMNRRLRTDLPTHHKQLLPKLTNHQSTRKMLEQRKLEQKEHYDRTAKFLPPLNPNDGVRVCQKGKWKPAVVVDVDETPRSYYVRTPDGSTFRRNRRHLLQVPKSEDNEQSTSTDKSANKLGEALSSPVKAAQERNPEQLPVGDHMITRSGRVVKKPQRFGDYV